MCVLIYFHILFASFTQTWISLIWPDSNRLNSTQLESTRLDRFRLSLDSVLRTLEDPSQSQNFGIWFRNPNSKMPKSIIHLWAMNNWTGKSEQQSHIYLSHKRFDAMEKFLKRDSHLPNLFSLSFFRHCHRCRCQRHRCRCWFYSIFFHFSWISFTK